MASIAEDESGRIRMEYTPEFVRSGYNPSPLFVTPQNGMVYDFSLLPRETFKGLPGFVADCLPDKFGTAIINHWLEKSGRPRDSYTTIERLLYQGSRAMGALRFEPQERKDLNKQVAIDLDGLVAAAAEVLSNRMQFDTNLNTDDEALLTILRVGTSAGGARPKAVVAYNKETGDLRSGQVDAPDGYEHWLLKLDGVDENNPASFGDTKNYGCLEYAYYRMVVDCDIEMMESRLLEDGVRHHFMTKRYDRIGGSHRVHKVSLCGMNHMDYNQPDSWSYEQLFSVMRGLRLSQREMIQAYRRMVFNVIGCNQDDHTKNVEFLMDTDGVWRLAPAFDMSFAYGVGYTRRHQMSVNGKRLHISRKDLLAVASEIDLDHREANAIIDRTLDVIGNFNTYINGSVPEWMVHPIRARLEEIRKEL
ncbi:MAG: type II toxin-antitoxin system HipA family toxin [Paludibacteraceae bacterium]|nr:type II toxin-antitoxin system HipA family toxin [Paludibacteraceae bacterium]